MVTFATTNKSLYQTDSNLANTRIHKRVFLQVTLFLRALTNHVTYGRKVQTANISEKGLLVISDVALKAGMEIEVTNARRSVKVLAEVKHVNYDPANRKWLIGLAIREKKTEWFINEYLPSVEPLLVKNFSLLTEEKSCVNN